MKILRYRSVKKIAAAGVMLFMWIGSTMAVPVYAGTPNVEIQIPVSVQGAAGTIVLEPEKAGIPVPDRTELQIGKDEKQSSDRYAMKNRKIITIRFIRSPLM